MTNTIFDFTAIFMGQSFEVTFNLGTDTKETILDFLKEQYLEANEDFNESDLEEDFEVELWGDVPSWLQDIDNLHELSECFDSSYDLDIYEAAFDADIQFGDVPEAYQGEYKSDEDFAESFAEELGYMNESKGWPFNCIDWKQAAIDLMMDYSEANGHYFRTL